MPERSPFWLLVRRVKKSLGKGLSEAWKQGYGWILLKGLAAVALFGVALLGILFLWYSRDLPDPDAIVARDIPQSTKIFDRTGEHLLYEIAPEEKRTLIKIEDIPLTLQQAVITAEDRDFYSHHGFSFRGMARAGFRYVTSFGQIRQGGSTITQQLVKNALFTNAKRLDRKVRELILSFALEQRFSKEQILQMYLNEIPYGGVLYGVESASQAYFGKSVKEVTLAEAATLAALPQRPSAFLANPDLLAARRDWILDGMVEEGYITQEQADAAKAENVVVNPAVGNIQAPHFVLWVKQQLEEMYGVQEVETGGLVVKTTLDFAMQEAAEAAVKEGVEKYGPTFGFANAGLVAIDPATGDVLAMVGSPDFTDTEHAGQVNVTLRELQPGSSIKPLVYAAAFEKGYTPNTLLWDVKTDFAGYNPQNYDGGEHGLVSMRQALQGSLNIPAVKTLYLVGVKDAVQFLNKMGYTSDIDPDRVGLSMVLGGAEIRMIEHVNAYATFAADGVHHDTRSLLSVNDATGTERYVAPALTETRPISTELARMVSNVLSDNGARAYIFGANNYLTLPGRPAAAKTGTTNDYKDAWTLGYTPQLAAGVWVGNASGVLMSRGADGSKVAAPIWQSFMKKALEGQPAKGFGEVTIPTTGKAVLDGQQPAKTVTLDRATGKLATERTPLSFQETKSCGEYHSILHYVDRADPRGPTPSNPGNDPFYASWEAAVMDYIGRHNASLKEGEQPMEICTVPTESDDVHIRDNEPSMRLMEPSPGDTVSGDIRLRYEANTVRQFSRVEVSLGDSVIATLGTPDGGNVTIPSWVRSGRQTLRVTVFDDVDNSASDQVNVQVSANNDRGPELHIVTPTNNQVIQRSTSSFDVAVEVSEEKDMSAVKVEVVTVSTGERISLGEVTNPGTIVKLPWSLNRDGLFRLEVSGTTRDNRRITGPSVNVLVRPADSIAIPLL